MEIWQGFKGVRMTKPPAFIQSIDTRKLSRSISGESERELSGGSIHGKRSSSGLSGEYITVKEGLLEKKAQTHVLRGWQNRYFKLEKDSFNTYVLRYFADEAEAKKNSGKNLAKKDKALDKLVKIQKVENTMEFNLVFEGDRANLHLRAKNSEDLSEWTEMLSKTKQIGFLSSPTK